MTKLERISLIIGDLAILLWIVSAGAISPVQLDNPLGVVFRAFLIFAVLWVLVGITIGTFATDNTIRHFLSRTLITWVIVGLVGIVLYRLIHNQGLHISGIFHEWTDSLLLLLLWRFAFRILLILLRGKIWIRNVTIAGLVLGISLGISVVGLKLSLIMQFRDDIYSVETAPTRQTVIILGAGLWYDGTPSTVMRNRVATGVALYERGVVQQIIMSGDGRNPQFDETTAMRQLAIEAGIPAQDILRDPGGTRTYNSCYHSANTFDVGSVILVTHAYHLYRALYTCDAMNMDVIGVAPVEAPTAFKSLVHREIREIAATVLAWWDLNILPPKIHTVSANIQS